MWVFPLFPPLTTLPCLLPLNLILASTFFYHILSCPSFPRASSSLQPHQEENASLSNIWNSQLKSSVQPSSDINHCLHPRRLFHVQFCGRIAEKGHREAVFGTSIHDFPIALNWVLTGGSVLELHIKSLWQNTGVSEALLLWLGLFL